MGMENWIERKNKCGSNEIIYFGRDYNVKQYFLNEVGLRLNAGTETDYNMSTRNLYDFINMCIEGLIEDKHQEYFDVSNDEYDQEERKQYWCRVLKNIAEGLVDYDKKNDMLVFVHSY